MTMTIKECLVETHERNERKRADAKADTGRKLILSDKPQKMSGAWIWVFAINAVALVVIGLVVWLVFK